MVGHTHQDFLSPEPVDFVDKYESYQTVPSQIKDIREVRELFDTPGHYFRKVNLSYLDEHIDNPSDWNRLVKPLQGIDCLFIMNDRIVTNAIMQAFAANRDRRYLAKFRQDGIPARIVAPSKQPHRPRKLSQ